MIEDQRTDKDRRHGARRRKTRRSGQRRTVSAPVDQDRRGSIRRRGVKRRGLADRRQSIDRRAGASPFDPAKAEQIQDIMTKTGVLIACPHCNQDLTLGPPVRRGQDQFREVQCLTCRRGMRIHNIP